MTQDTYHSFTPESAALDEAGLQALMRRYQAGDREAAEQLVQHLSPMLLRFLRGPTATRDQAHDLLQQCWLEVHRARHTFRSDAPVLPWLFAIARHVRRDAWRHGSRAEHSEVALDQVPEQTLVSSAAVEPANVLKLLDHLPTTQRELVVMLKLDGLSLEEAAAETSSTVGAVKQRAHRAYESLRRLLREGVLVSGG